MLYLHKEDQHGNVEVQNLYFRGRGSVRQTQQEINHELRQNFRSALKIRGSLQ